MARPGGNPGLKGVKGKSGTKSKEEFKKQIMSNEAFVEAMKEMRDKIVEKMKEKMDKADYRALNDSLDKMTKNIQLLSGGATENVNFIDGIQYIKPNE